MTEWERLQEELGQAMSTAKSIDGAIRRQIGGTPRWSELGLSVIDRGRYAIFPLAAAVVTEGGESDDEQFLKKVDAALISNWGHWYGDHYDLLSSVDVDEGYGRKLAEAGGLGRGPDWWGIEHFAVVLVRAVDQSRAFETLSLHVIPKDWVWYITYGSVTKREVSHHRRLMRELKAADVAWSWPFAVADDGEAGNADSASISG